jgi:hypothetical protein
MVESWTNHCLDFFIKIYAIIIFCQQCILQVFNKLNVYTILVYLTGKRLSLFSLLGQGLFLP